ncbi:MAG: glucose-6-phosphate isomerase [Epsilonproteobacteria bacterium]|nr:glucose-6-phosphate isomerase [Campylobacterota bacterium]
MVKNTLYFQDDPHDDEIKRLYDAVVEEYEGTEVGYYHLPKSTVVTEIKVFCDSYDFDAKGIKNVAILGIGGSSLGTKAIDSLLKNSGVRNNKNLLFFENVDPTEIAKNLDSLKLEETFFIVISKSGSTIETTSHLKFLLHHFQLDFESEAFKTQFVFITDEGSPLDRFGDEFGVKRFYIPTNVGGRFSVLSAVGLLPLCILGYDIEKLLNGAATLCDSFFAKKEDEICKKALFYGVNAEERPINVLFSYHSAFSDFNDWYVQLWAESLGKIDLDGTRVGLTPVGLIGSVDQHSFLQLIIEGRQDKSVTLVKVEDFSQPLEIPDIRLPYLESTDYINGNSFATLINAQCDATMQSIKDQNVPVDLIEVSKLEEESVGYLIFYYELLTSLTGIVFNINTYDQPGVELGKKILKKKFSN